MERVLHDRHRVQLDEPRTRPLVRLEVARELLAEMRLPEGDVPAPADASVADIGAAEVIDPRAEVGQCFRRREVDLPRRWAELLVDQPEEAVEHCPLERSRPGDRGRYALPVRV